VRREIQTFKEAENLQRPPSKQKKMVFKISITRRFGFIFLFFSVDLVPIFLVFYNYRVIVRGRIYFKCFIITE